MAVWSLAALVLTAFSALAQVGIQPAPGRGSLTPPMSQSVAPPPTTTPPDATGTPYSSAPNAPPVTPAPNPEAGLDTNPLKGANSFTEAQARTRMAGRGFSDITGLALDHDGIWRATATRNGRPFKAWLDYRGRVGIQ